MIFVQRYSFVEPQMKFIDNSFPKEFRNRIPVFGYPVAG